MNNCYGTGTLFLPVILLLSQLEPALRPTLFAANISGLLLKVKSRNRLF